HCEGKRGMKNSSQGAQAPAPGRIKHLLIEIAPIQDMFAEQQVEMVMAVLMNQIVDQVKAIAIEQIDEGEARPIAITETDDPSRLQRNHTRGQQHQQVRTAGPDLLDRRESSLHAHRTLAR